MILNFWNAVAFVSALVAIYSFSLEKWLKKRYCLRNGHTVAAICEYNGQRYCCFHDDMGIKYEAEIDNDADISEYLTESPYGEDDKESVQFVNISYNRVDPYEVFLCDEDDEEYTLEKIAQLRKRLFKLSVFIFVVSSIIFSIRLVLC